MVRRYTSLSVSIRETTCSCIGIDKKVLVLASMLLASDDISNSDKNFALRKVGRKG
jgi:hypothetical protein